MPSPIDRSFVRDLHPFPVRDRRLVLHELGIADVDHRDEDSFYDWLAGMYRAGEAGAVDAALRRCCGKAEERTSTQRAIAWLLDVTGVPRPTGSDAQAVLATLATLARAEGEEIAALLDALAPNFGWAVAGDTGGGEIRPADLTVATVAARLAAALDGLAEQPDGDLLLRAAALADAIEAHLGGLEGRRRDALRARIEEALAGLDPQAVGGALPSPPEDAGIDALERLTDQAERARDGWAAFAAAREAARAAIDASRSERRAAQDRLEQAEDAWDAARADLLALRDEGPGEPRATGAATGAAVDAPEPDLSDAAVDTAAADESPDATVPDIDPEAAVILEPEPAPQPEPEAVAEPVAPPDEPAEETEAVAIPVPESVAPAEAEPPLAPVGDWDAWITTALAGGRVGLARHLADARDQVGGHGTGLPAAVMDALLHGRATRSAYDGAWHRYEALRDPLLAAAAAGREDAQGHACTLLLLAGALRPALLQSQAALDVADALQGDLAASLNPLVRLLQDLRGSGIGAVADIAAPAGETERRARAKAARGALEEWRRTAQTRTASFQGATAIWQTLVAPDGAIGHAFQQAVSGAPGSQEEARRLIDRLTDEADALIDETDEARSGRGRRNPVVGGARKQLRNFFAGAADLLDAWLQAEGAGAQADDRHRQRRGELVRALAAAREVAVATAPRSALEAASASVFRDVADGLAAELQGRLDPNPALSSDDELALLPAFALNARRDVRVDAVDAPALAAAAAEALAGGTAPGAAAAFDRALELGGISSARRLLPHLPAGQRAADEQRLERRTVEERRRLSDRARELRQRLDDLQIALTESDQLPETVERDMSAFEGAKIDALPLDAAERGDLADFPTAHRRLDHIEERLEQARTPVAARLGERIAAQEQRLGQPLDECRALLDKGDLGTLTEYVAQVERHGSPGAAGESTLDLLRRFAALAGALGDRPVLDLPRLARTARQGGRDGDFAFADLPASDRPRAEALLHAWLELRRAVQVTGRGEPPKLREKVAEVLRALGFTGVRVEDARRDKAWFHLTVATDPLRRREHCLAPAFGSEADGRYAVAVILDGEERSALSLFDHLPDRVLLLAPVPLSPRLRRDLQRAARGSGRSVALADTLTAAVLATEPEAGTRAFFDLALPFGAAWPYVDSGSHTSIEMFFGRESELRQLVDRQGACLVYGGRQLGKTALLKQIELRENVGADRVAIYCDIRPVGESMPATEVWDRIAERLRERRVTLPDGATLPDRLRAWVQAAPGRYMLVLLDEADAFLDAEMAADFPEIGRMKALMEETGRGVKFVFAGLHNVQRFHRAPNSPLLHFGSSINVGPLLGGDREAARQMAFEPMAALGATFEQPVDAYHMLSLVGFYPSLVQSFGKTIVQALGDQLKRAGEGPELPVPIRRSLIDDCFGQQAFRTGVVERFQKTLQLDQRYELITYAVWQQAQQDTRSGRGGARGYAASEIRQMADFWWAAGFRDTDSPDSFAAILDEMVEMGVLAREGERYGLRSQRIAAMLGTEAEIEDRLQSFSERAPKRRADPMTSHRRIGGVWSPLSLRQEAALAERLARRDDPAHLLLLGATPATGAEDLPEALTTLAQSLRWPEPRRLSAQRASVILDVARAVKKEAGAGKPKLVIVSGGWPSPGDLAELRRHRVLRDPQQPVRLAFCGLPDPALLEGDEQSDCMRVVLGPLPVESMVHWMHRERLPFADQEEVQAALRHATGGLLEVLDSMKRPAPADRGDHRRLLERAEAAAAALAPADLGLDASAQAFARTLGEMVGADAFTGDELDDWAREHSGDTGIGHLRRLQTLGVVEATPGSAGRRCWAFNPAALRVLA